MRKKGFNHTPLDALQVKMFEVLYKIKQREMPQLEAFAYAICNTSDDIARPILNRKRKLVRRWIKEYYCQRGRWKGKYRNIERNLE